MARPDETDEVLEAVFDAVGWDPEGARVTPITTGITNRNYLVDAAGQRFVVRLAGHDTELLGIDRATEFEAGSAAFEAGVGPEIVRWLPDLGCSITRFIEADHIPERDLLDPGVLELVATTIRTFHACPPVSTAFPVFRIVERYRALAAARRVAIPSVYDDAHRVAGEIERTFGAAPMPLATCHDDLLNANMLRTDDHVWLVDFEYAGMGDVFFDLGNLAVNNGLDEPAMEHLLRAYFGDVTDVHRARLALMRVMSDFREAMWGVVQQAISTLDVDYVEYASSHFDRLLTNARDDRFDAWLDAAAHPVV